MRDIVFRVWHLKEKKMYYRGYQKVSHVLLCEDDRGSNDGKGKPVKKADYGECEFLETTSLFDKKGTEIFEGDIVELSTGMGTFQGVVGDVPDMFRSRKIHPLAEIFEKHGLKEEDILEIEVVGNRYEERL